jgi:hypothetical protein
LLVIAHVLCCQIPRIFIFTEIKYAKLILLIQLKIKKVKILVDGGATVKLYCILMCNLL